MFAGRVIEHEEQSLESSEGCVPTTVGKAAQDADTVNSSAIASNDVLIVFLGLPRADPSLDLRFAIILITSVCVSQAQKNRRQ